MKLYLFLLLILLSLVSGFGQIRTAIHIKILMAEDARRYDKILENLLKDPHYDVRTRAALAAGRIGDEAAIPALLPLLEKGTAKEREMAAFALGEIESIKAADAVLNALKTAANVQAETRAVASVPQSAQVVEPSNGRVLARLVEAAGKITAANAKDERSKTLGRAILGILDAEAGKGAKQNRDVILFGLTAILRAKPDGGDLASAKFLTNPDARVRADAANTLSRLKGKNANEMLRAMLNTDRDPIARANAARALGSAEDKEAVNILLAAAIEDKDSRVRVSAIRALGNLKDAKVADKLSVRGEKLLAEYKKSKFRSPVEKNELLEIATSLGRLVSGSENRKAISFLASLRTADKRRSAEIEIALAAVAPKFYYEHEISGLFAMRDADLRTAAVIFQGYGQIMSLEKKDEYKEILQETNFQLLKFAEGWFWDEDKTRYAKGKAFPIPEMLRAFTKDKSDSLGMLLPLLDREKDVFVRATLAELLADQRKSKQSIEALIVAFARSLETDRDYNDAQLAILDALYKLDKRESVGSLLRALNAPDHLVRKKAFEMLSDSELQGEFPEIVSAVSLARRNGMDELLPHTAETTQVINKSGTKLGQILNTQADYKRAVLRKNGSVRVVVMTEKGEFTIDLLPENAPLTVDNFIKVARARYFNGLEVHRVVPNFVMQDGDPRGDGNGGPGWSIRCEINMVPYERGAVGMALSGKDTGGSQWFVTHSPQPHLDGGYTVFGRVNETGMRVVDNIVRGDKIVTVKIIGDSPQRTQRKSQNRER